MSAIKPTTTYFVITLILGVFGGAIAYVVLRKDYPKQAKQILLIGVVISAIWTAVFVSAMNDNSDDSEDALQDSTPTKLDSEKEILEFIQNYKGKDNSGPAFNEVFDGLLVIAYPGENITENPSTTGYFIASPDVSREISNRYWKVEFELQTYRERVHYEWIVDTETNSVYAANERANDILTILDNFDK